MTADHLLSAPDYLLVRKIVADGSTEAIINCVGLGPGFCELIHDAMMVYCEIVDQACRIPVAFCALRVAICDCEADCAECTCNGGEPDSEVARPTAWPRTTTALDAVPYPADVF